MAILVRLKNFCYVSDFGKAVATALVGTSKIPMVKVDIHSFSPYRVSHEKGIDKKLSVGAAQSFNS